MYLEVRWTFAATNTGWPTNWHNSPDGGLVGIQPINQIEAGGEEIFIFEWNLPDVPEGSDVNTCLIARIMGNEDPILDYFADYEDDLASWIRDDNNIAMKNLVVSNTNSTKTWNGFDVPPGDRFVFRNCKDNYKEFNLYFGPSNDYNNSFLDECEINMFVTNKFWDIIDNSPNASFNGIEIINDNNIRIIGGEASIKNINIAGNEVCEAYLGFNFYGERGEDTDSTFYFVIKQKEANEEERWKGNVHFFITKNARQKFSSDAGSDIVINDDSYVNLFGNTISEPADYSWETIDTLISHQVNSTFKPNNSEYYRYEITSKNDGFKSYDSVYVKVKHNFIKSISPNPSSMLLNISYKTQNANNVKIMLQMVGSVKNKHIYYNLPKGDNIFTLNVSNYNTGLYNIILICDGIERDSQKVLVN